MSKEILIVGHKNPDTDSICSAIAYANLKNKLFPEKHVAKRAGEISEETRFVLERLQVPSPELLEYAGTQVRDIEIKKAKDIQKDISLKKAWSVPAKPSSAPTLTPAPTELWEHSPQA